MQVLRFYRSTASDWRPSGFQPLHICINKEKNGGISLCEFSWLTILFVCHFIRNQFDLQSISTTIYELLLHQSPKNYNSQTVIREKLRKAFSYKKGLSKMLMKLTPVSNRITPWVQGMTFGLYLKKLGILIAFLLS
jgi:hypothetical protein